MTKNTDVVLKTDLLFVRKFQRILTYEEEDTPVENNIREGTKMCNVLYEVYRMLA